MSAALRNGVTLAIAVNVELLELYEVGSYFKTPKRPTAYENLSWWLHIYPNGDSSENEGYVTVFLFTSVGGFEVEYSLTVDKSDIRGEKNKCFGDNPIRRKFLHQINHENHLSAEVIEDGEFTIHYSMHFRKTLRTSIEIPEIVEDSCIINLSQNELQTSEPCQKKQTDRQIVNGIAWNCDCYPCGYHKDDQGYVSVFLNVEYIYTFLKVERQVPLEVSYALSVGGVLIHKTFSYIFVLTGENIGLTRLFSHELCKRADQNNGAIDLMCSIAFNSPDIPPTLFNHPYEKFLYKKLPFIDQEAQPTETLADVYEFEDTKTLIIDAEWLNLFQHEDCFMSEERSIPQCKNLYWWIQCIPNRVFNEHDHYVSVLLCASIGSYEVTETVTVLRSDVRNSETFFFDKVCVHGCSKLISHEELRTGDAIKNGVFEIKCDIKFKISKEIINEIKKLELLEDTCVLQFNRKLLDTYEPKQCVVGKSMKEGIINWAVSYLPFGMSAVVDKDYGKVFLCMGAGGIRLEHYCGIIIGGIFIQKAVYVQPVEHVFLDHYKFFSHNLCKLADHNNGVIDLIFKVKFYKPLKTATEEIRLECPLNGSIGTSVSTSKNFVRGSDKHQLQLHCFPDGNCTDSKGYSAALCRGENLTIAFNAELLNLVEVGCYFKTPKRPTAYENLYWWLHIYPNGDTPANIGHITVVLFTSIGGFEVEHLLKIGKIECVKNKCYGEQPIKLVTLHHINHGNHLSDAIEDGEVTFQYTMKFRKTSRTVMEIPETISDSCIIKLSHTDLARFKPGSYNYTNKHIVNGIIWVVSYFPCGFREDDKDYVSALFSIAYIYSFVKIERPVTLEISYALSVGGVLIYKTVSHTFFDTTYFGHMVSHELCKRADHNNGVIDVICSIVFIPKDSPRVLMNETELKLMNTFSALNVEPKPTAVPNEMEIEQTFTLTVDADWLNFLEPLECFATAQLPIPGCKNLYWWIQCFPCGMDPNQCKHVCAYVYFSIGGFERTLTITILRSDVKYIVATTFQKPVPSPSVDNLICPNKLRMGDTIKNGIFEIKFDVKLKIPKETIERLNKLVILTDLHTIYFDRKLLETGIPGQPFVEQRQTVGDITWWIEYFPCGGTEADKSFVSVYFHVIGGPVMMQYFCSMQVDGVPIKRYGYRDYLENGNYGTAKLFSHKTCRIADHKDNIVPIQCEIKFFKPIETIKDCIFFQTPFYANVGAYVTTQKQFVKCSAKHQWQLICFPAGCCTNHTGHVSATIEMSTTEIGYVRMKGMIKILIACKVIFEQPLDLVVEKENKFHFPQLISHQVLQQIGAFAHNAMTISCEADFYTFI